MHALAHAAGNEEQHRSAGSHLRLAHTTDAPQTMRCADQVAGNDMAAVMELEQRTAALCLPHLRQLAADHPDWMDRLDFADPDICGPDTLWGLLESAPNEFARGLVFGKVTLRTEAAALTGRF